MSNYPAGAEFDSNAPYNKQRGQDIEEVSVWASNTLSKNVTLEVENCDNIHKQIHQLYHDNQYTAKEALDLAAEFAKKIHLSIMGIPVDFCGTLDAAATRVFNACKGWEEDEFEVVKDI